jgi:hypothetical protein
VVARTIRNVAQIAYPPLSMRALRGDRLDRERPCQPSDLTSKFPKHNCRETVTVRGIGGALRMVRWKRFQTFQYTGEE